MYLISSFQYLSVMYILQTLTQALSDEQSNFTGSFHLILNNTIMGCPHLRLHDIFSIYLVHMPQKMSHNQW